MTDMPILADTPIMCIVIAEEKSIWGGSGYSHT